MSWLRGGGSNDPPRNPSAGLPPRQGQSPAPASSLGRSGYSSVPQHEASNTSLPPYGGQQQGAPSLPSRSQRPPPQYNAPGGAKPGQLGSGGGGGQFEVVPTPVDSLVPRNVSLALPASYCLQSPGRCSCMISCDRHSTLTRSFIST